MERMTATWTGGLRFVHQSGSGHALVSDAPADHGGLGSAPSPMELVVMGLMGCTGVDVATILAKMKQPVEKLEISATWERAEDHPRIYTKIHLLYEFSGDLDAKKVKRAVDLSASKYCSVSAMLTGTTEITHEIRL